MKNWIKAFRLRTLPLALASIFMGSFIAFAEGKFDIKVFFWCTLTTILLQILSNLANDYGDHVNGADHAGRKGPVRTVQSGAITALAMRNAVIICSILSFLSGIILLKTAFQSNWLMISAWLLIGLFCIAAAILYTVGRKPYGYMGLGDISVTLFFGIVGVMGACFMYTHQFNAINILPSLSCGFLATGVLNINNIRDIESDRMAGKFSIPVRIGKKAAAVYQKLLLISALGFAVAFMISRSSFDFFNLLFLIVVPLFWTIGRAVSTLPSEALDPWLKKMALTSVLFVILFGLGLNWPLF